MATSRKTKSVIKSVEKSLKKKNYEVVSIRIKKIPKKAPPKKQIAKVLNPVTGRLIIKGGPRFIQLIEEGYSFRVIKKKLKTRITGYLVPPETVVKTIAKKEKVPVSVVKNEIKQNINNQVANEAPKQNARAKLGSALGGFASGILSGGANNGNKGVGVIGEEKTNVVSSNNTGNRRNNNTGNRRNNNTGNRMNNNTGNRRNNNMGPRMNNNMGPRMNNNTGPRMNNNTGPRMNNNKKVGVIGQEGVTQVSNQNGGGLVKNNGSNRPEPVERKPENLKEIKRNNSQNVAKITAGEGAVMGKPMAGYKAKEPEKNNAFDKMLVKEGSKINS